ncbi:uncharacterized protein BCR38DRAFT_484914 [Pseudomassariella vexata]|uniref:GH16 domain-containing protein n=1 Tax=Pseudomassariella vexata TaxID=1141098 RepID=A0A1Y2E1W5_9PEZI|nr:uncharacterized protein BCR38DRAFT_484914 [Pseudomassariella vexata]ORY65499.1 hypothetical protein BCR38DRAFT_484914 [Pseudomassariella vexata]
MTYSLSTHYTDQGLLDGFSFFTRRDLSHGFVDYQSRANAEAQGLVSVDEYNRKNLFSAHTLSGCTAPSSVFSGEQGPTNCGPGNNNAGCNYASLGNDSSYGDAFNVEGGGVYALEWNSDGLKIWHFTRSKLPGDIVFAPIIHPDPSSWGPPQAFFGGSSCDTDSFFNMSLVININLCGDYAANVWGVTDKCNELAPGCEEWVAGHPEALLGAYWNVNYIDVYQKVDTTNPAPFPNTTISPTATGISSAMPLNTSAPAPTNTRVVTPHYIDDDPHPGRVRRRAKRSSHH